METAKETVNNLINTASTMIYGDKDQSGNATTTSSGGGAHDPHDTLLGDNGASAEENIKAHQSSSADNTSSAAGGAAGGSSSADSSDPAPSDPNSSSTAASTGPSGNAAADVGSAPPESGAAPETEHQGASDPTDKPDAEESAAIADNKAAVEDTMESADNSGGEGGSSGPSTDDSAGPKPLTGGASDGPGAGAGGAKPGDDLGSKSEEKGTGEKYIKSSGTQADGGDFDAANAGAGREADRLMEEKGFHRDGGNQGPPEEVPGNEGAHSSSADATGDKPSLGQKIKDKLHIGNKDKP